MQKFFEAEDGRRYRFVEVASAPLPEDLFPAEEHACMIALVDPDLARELREHVAEALVASGCRWVSVHGDGASQWGESIDWANVDACADLPPESDFVVVTTSHETEPLPEVANTFAHIRGDHGVFQSNLVVILGASPQTANVITQTLEAAQGAGAA